MSFRLTFPRSVKFCLLWKRDVPGDQTKLNSLGYVTVVSIVFVQKGCFLFFASLTYGRRKRRSLLERIYSPLLTISCAYEESRYVKSGEVRNLELVKRMRVSYKWDLKQSALSKKTHDCERTCSLQTLTDTPNAGDTPLDGFQSIT